jgi:hypothetical protein
MSNSPDEIRRDIEATRRELGQDVDALTEKVSPARVVERRVERAKGAATGVKEKVMGVASSGTGGAGAALSGTQDKLSSAASSVTGAGSSAPAVARQKAQGNPLAAGVIAFGVGWLASSLLPASEKEQQAAVAVKDKASESAEAIKQPLSEAASEVKDNLREPAQQAAEAVKSTATDAASNVRGEAQSAGDKVTQQAQESKQTVSDSH